MLTTDRRSGEERRRAERSKVTIDVEWENSAGRRAGTLSDISEFGFFVLSDGKVEDGENVKIFLPLSDGMKVEFAARVTNHVFEIGFAGSFVDITAAQKEFLGNFVALHKED